MKNLLSLILLSICLIGQAQKKITSIPFELFGDHMFIKVSVDNSDPLEFVFDTGAGLTVIDWEVAENLELVKNEVEMNETHAKFQLIKHSSIAIYGFLMEKNVNIYATDLHHLETSLGREFDGILGYDLLHHHTVHIDYDKLTMDIYDHGNGPKDGDEIPFKLYTSIPTVEGEVVLNNNEPHDGLFFIMTGAGTTLDFNSSYSESWDVTHKTGKHYSYPVKGIGDDETPHYEGHVLSFKFGNQVVEDLPIGISTAKEGIQAHKKVAGIIGNRILREFNITIDVPDKKIWIKKNSHYGEKFNVNSSGLDLVMSKDMDKVIIHQVFDEGPAKDAGIKVDAELVSLNGKPATEYALPDIKTILRRSGQTADLVVRQDGEDKKVSLKLKSLLEN